jgi:osmotically-inducible protein OsmY
MTTTQRHSVMERPLFWTLLFTLFVVAGFAWVVQRSDGDFGAAAASVQRASSAAIEALIPDADRAPIVAAAPDPRIEHMANRVADLEMKAAVQQALLAAPHGLAGAVAVEAAAGRVTLEGQVTDTDERYRAELAARSVPGVAAVENRLTVPAEAPQPRADERLAKAVEFELYATGAFDTTAIQIVADKGVVRLGGKVRSAAERLLAERVAREVDGVARVLNALEVRPAEPVPAES